MAKTKIIGIFLLLLSLTQMMSSVTVYGQLTPQRINYNGNKGIFFTDKQEELLLKSIVDYDYLQKSIAGKDKIIKTQELRLLDKEFEIKKMAGYLLRLQKSPIQVLKTLSKSPSVLNIRVKAYMSLTNKIFWIDSPHG